MGPALGCEATVAWEDIGCGGMVGADAGAGTLFWACSGCDGVTTVGGMLPALWGACAWVGEAGLTMALGLSNRSFSPGVPEERRAGATDDGSASPSGPRLPRMNPCIRSSAGIDGAQYAS